MHLRTILYIYIYYIYTDYIISIISMNHYILSGSICSECMCIHVCKMKKKVMFSYRIIYHHCENEQYISLEKKASLYKLLISQNHLPVLATVKILQLLVGFSQNFSIDSIFSTFLKNKNGIILYILF